MYILLCGYPPFSGNCGTQCGWNMGEACNACQELLFHSIQDGQFEFPDQEWANISLEAKSLISNLLVKNASQRLSAKMVLSHPWVKQGGSARLLVTPQNIRRNNSARELSAFAESAMAVNRVVLQHMSINNLKDNKVVEEEDDDHEDGIVMKKKDDKEDTGVVHKNKKNQSPMGLSPPSESKLMQRRHRNSHVISVSCCLHRRSKRKTEEKLRELVSHS